MAELAAVPRPSDEGECTHLAQALLRAQLGQQVLAVVDDIAVALDAALELAQQRLDPRASQGRPRGP